MEIKRAKGPAQQMSAAELFSGTPPLEAVRLLCSLLVTMRVSLRKRPLKLGFWDVSRAHLYGTAQRDIYIRLPEDQGGQCVKLLRSMYGTQDASKIWHSDWAILMEAKQWRIGAASPAVLFRESDGGRGLVHGDDFMVLGDQETLDDVNQTLSERYDMKCSGTLGPEDADDKEVVF